MQTRSVLRPRSPTLNEAYVRSRLRDDVGVTLGGDHDYTSRPSSRWQNSTGRWRSCILMPTSTPRDTYFGEDYTHGSPFRRASEEGLIVKGSSAHVGIRGSLYPPEDLEDDEKLGFTIIHCRDFDRLGADEVLRRILARVGDAQVYVSIDIDVLDPSGWRRAPAPPKPAA